MALLVRCAACRAEFRAAEKHRGKHTQCANCEQSLVIDGATIPDFDVFISYSSSDRNAADAICAALEAKRLRCWVAPRNVLPGSEWGAAIIEGIEQSRLMVLVYSAHANRSQQVLREIERAVSKGLPLIPFRLEAVPPSKNMEYFLSTSHWMDAMTQPLERHVEELAESVKLLLWPRDQGDRGARAAGPGAAAVMGMPFQVVSPGQSDPGNGRGGLETRLGQLLVGLAAVTLAAVAIGGVLVAARGTRQGPDAAARAEASLPVTATLPTKSPAISRESTPATLPAVSSETPPETQPAVPPATSPSISPVTPQTQPAKPEGIRERVVLLSKRSFKLRRGHRDERYPVTVPQIASGSGWLQIQIENMGDNGGDMGMYCSVLDAAGNVVMRRFGRDGVAQIFTYEVRSQTSWSVVLTDKDTRGSGNGGSIQIAVVPK